MGGIHLTSGRLAKVLLTIACWGAAPALGQMQMPAPVRWLVYRNDTGVLPLRIQSGGLLPNGMPRFGQPHLVPASGRVGVPGGVAWDPIAVAGPKVILVTDPQNPNRVYFRGQIVFGNQNQLYSVQAAGVGPDKVPRVRLVPIAFPPMMAMPRAR